MSNILIMHWDRVDSLGDPIAGIEILSYDAIEIPPTACGFRLELPNQVGWPGAWYFAAPGVQGQPFESGGIEYSSACCGFGWAPDPIVATGPVHACTSGSYFFQTPLATFGISGDAPVIAGAGSFVAEFSSEDDIEWLDFAGQVVPKAHPPTGEPKIPKLPPEFFEKLPRLKPCIRDFEQKLHCPMEASQGSLAPDPDALTLSVSPPPGIALLVAAGNGILPQVKAISAPAEEVNDTPHGSKLEVTCPAELVLTATFFKDHTFEPAIAAYRFRFAHGPVSTVFSTLVDKDGENTVFHSVPIPLPPPIGGNPGGGGGVPPGPGTVAVVVKPIEPINPGGNGPPTSSQEFTVEALPGNEHRSSVRVEVVNAFEGVVSSEWATYHLVCVSGSHRPGLLPGSLGVVVISLQAGLNRWLKSQKMTPLKVDGVFGPRTEAAVRAFQKDRRLDVDGKVGTKTWREVLSQK